MVDYAWRRPVAPAKRNHLIVLQPSQKGPDIVPIPGTKRVTYLEENVAAASVALDAAQMSAFDAALAPEKIAGARYNATSISTIDR